MFHRDRMVGTKVVAPIYYYDCLKYGCHLLVAIKASVDFEADFRGHGAVECLAHYG